MKFAQLKQLTYSFWTDVLLINGAVIECQRFKPEMRQQFGDLRRRDSWEKALARFYAQIIHDACLDACNLILHGLNFRPGDRLYDYRYIILDEFLSFPDGLEMLKTGLEDIFQSSHFTPEEQQEANGNGFFAMVREQSSGGILHGRAVEFIGQLAGAG